jgi:hypothetical protein
MARSTLIKLDRARVPRFGELASARVPVRTHATCASLCAASQARPHVRLGTGRLVSQYAGSEGCAGLAGTEPHAWDTGLGGSDHVCRA